MPPETVEPFLEGGDAVFQGQIFHAIFLFNAAREKRKLKLFAQAVPLRLRLGRPPVSPRSG